MEEVLFITIEILCITCSSGKYSYVFPSIVITFKVNNYPNNLTLPTTVIKFYVVLTVK